VYQPAEGGVVARFRLIPKEESFYELFVQQSQILVSASELLKDIVDNFDDIKPRAGRMHDLEHEGDEVTHEVMRRLNTTFVTPIDREDIHELASNLDDVLDYLDAAADLLVLHNIEQPIPEMKAQADLLVKASRTTLEAMSKLPKFDDLAEHWVEINRLENEADRIYRKSIADLFSGDYKAMDVLKWKDIIDQLEKAMDKLEDVANTLEGIALKHA
jgi:predicted phosphate transport protein (TIGR00153 family)